jgi:hypothetical protein
MGKAFVCITLGFGSVKTKGRFSHPCAQHIVQRQAQKIMSERRVKAVSAGVGILAVQRNTG